MYIVMNVKNTAIILIQRKSEQVSLKRQCEDIYLVFYFVFTFNGC